MNELPVLGWKGGIEKISGNKVKFGSLYYLAKWQGLWGDDLRINPQEEIEITCSRTGMTVIFTPDRSKYS